MGTNILTFHFPSGEKREPPVERRGTEAKFGLENNCGRVSTLSTREETQNASKGEERGERSLLPSICGTLCLLLLLPSRVAADSRFFLQELNWIRTQMGQDFALIPSSRSRRIRSVNGGAVGDGIDEIGGATFCKTKRERNGEFLHIFCSLDVSREGGRDALLQQEQE